MKKILLGLFFIFLTVSVFAQYQYKMLMTVYSDEKFGFAENQGKYVTTPLVEVAKKEGYKPDGTPLITYSWQIGDWIDPINKPICGPYQQIRDVKCVDDHGNVVDDSKCIDNVGEKPEISRDAEDYQKCVYKVEIIVYRTYDGQPSMLNDISVETVNLSTGMHHTYMYYSSIAPYITDVSCTDYNINSLFDNNPKTGILLCNTCSVSTIGLSFSEPIYKITYNVGRYYSYWPGRAPRAVEIRDLETSESLFLKSHNKDEPAHTVEVYMYQ